MSAEHACWYILIKTLECLYRYSIKKAFGNHSILVTKMFDSDGIKRDCKWFAGNMENVKQSGMSNNGVVISLSG